MNYSIGEVSRMFGLPQSTLRYYDKEGLLPHIQRQGAASAALTSRPLKPCGSSSA